jgi:hypothetical protein
MDAPIYDQAALAVLLAHPSEPRWSIVAAAST